MTVWRADPERAATALVEASLDDMALATGARMLLIEADTRLARIMTGAGYAVMAWQRRMRGDGDAASAMPPPGPFDAALLRLPKAKDELEMHAHLACGVLRNGGRLFIYGGNDEGIKTAAKRLASLSGDVTTVTTRLHGRIIAIACDGGVRARVRPRLEAWRMHVRDGWLTYPGLFAEGTLDAGTALLIDHLPTLPKQARVLDYGCGPGALSDAVRKRASDAKLDAVDHDAVALVACAENVPGGRTVLGRDLGAVADARYDLIVSNPPLHVGFREDHGALHAFIAACPRHLTSAGMVMMVVQRRVPLDELLRRSFTNVEVTAETGTYRVWTARLPIT